jgi:CubicO group peptidase (beta-lactamase class C family)
MRRPPAPPPPAARGRRRRRPPDINPRMDLDGSVAPGFEPVASAFERNFAELGEIGAAVAVYHGDRLMVDLAGGTDPVRGRRFTRDTLMMVASCTKGATATCVLMLAEAGVVDVDEPVASYWPEFGQAGKGDIPLRWVLSHQAGLPYPDPEADVAGLDQLAGPALLRQLERQAPWWQPGTAFAYHPVTYGTILDEVVRRVTGQTIGAWFAEHVAAPLNLDFWIGLPPELDDRVAPSVWQHGHDRWADEPAAKPPPPGSYAARRRAAIARLPPMDPDPHDAAARRAYYGIEVPAAHGIANARSLARMYAALLDEVDGVRLLSPDSVAAATTPQTDGLEALIESGTTGPDIRFGLGYQLASASMPGLGPASFGHTGAGARLGLADADLDVAFGYVCNSMRDIGPSGDPRWATLLTAVGDCLRRAPPHSGDPSP